MSPIAATDERKDLVTQGSVAEGDGNQADVAFSP